MFAILRLLLSLSLNPDACAFQPDPVACVETVCVVGAADYDTAECEGIAARLYGVP